MSKEKIPEVWKDEFFYFNGLDLNSRCIYIGSTSDTDGTESGIDYDISGRVIKGLRILDSRFPSTEPLTIIINSPGGQWDHGIAIYDAIKLSNRPTTIEVYGAAMSMASIILQAGDVRKLSPNSTIMIHEGEETLGGHPKDIKRWSDELERESQVMYDIYMSRIKEKKPRFKLNDIIKMCDHDTILTAREAIELGLADEIMEYPNKKPVRKKK